MRAILAVPVVAVAVLMGAPSSIGELENQKAQYERAAETARAKADWIQGKINSLSDTKRALDEEAAAATADYEKKKAALDETVSRIEGAELKILEADRDYQRKHNRLAQRVRDIYINGRISYLDVMFGVQDFGDFITRMDLLKRVLAQDSDLVNAVLQEKAEIEALAVQLEADRKIQAEQLHFATKAREYQLEKVAEQQALIDRMENDRAVYNQRYDEMAAASKEVERLIQESKYRAAAEAAAREQAAQERAAKAERERIAREQRQAQERAQREQERLARERDRAERERERAENPRRYVKNDDVQVFVPEGTGEMLWPVTGAVTSEYGWRTHPIFGGSKFHSGIDIAADYGEPIRAARGGVVTHSGWIDGYGNTIMIDHGGGLVTLYGHNQSVAVDVGQKVRQGQIVAYCGSTGNSTGPHCHFEVRRNGEPVSPYDFL